MPRDSAHARHRPTRVDRPGAARARGRGRAPVLAAALLFHAAVSLAALPVVHVVLVHGATPDAAQVSGSTRAHDAASLHETICLGCTLARISGAPPATVTPFAVLEPVLVHVPADASDIPSPIRGAPLGGRAPPLV